MDFQRQLAFSTTDISLWLVNVAWNSSVGCNVSCTAFIWEAFALVTSAVSFLPYPLLASYSNPSFQEPINENLFVGRLWDALLLVLGVRPWDLKCAFLGSELLVKGGAVIGAKILDSCLQQGGVTRFYIDLNLLLLKSLYFPSFIKTYDYQNTLLRLLSGPWTGHVQVKLNLC